MSQDLPPARGLGDNVTMSEIASLRPREGDALPLTRLVQARWGVLPALALLVLGAPPLLGFSVPILPLLTLLALLGLFNFLLQGQLPHLRPAEVPATLFRQLLLDIATLAMLLFLTGGATNPLVSLLLPPIILAALTLSGRQVLVIGLLAVLAYSVLLFAYLPLPLSDPARATRLHLFGMWATFAASALLIGVFALRLTARLRARDAALAEAREEALRAERVLALGTLAAGAAHELSTPLNSIALLAGDLAEAPGLSLEDQADITQIRVQVAACRDILNRLTQSAGAARHAPAPAEAAGPWLERLCQRWQSLRPAYSCLLDCRTAPEQAMVADPRLAQSLLNLLNNAADAQGDPAQAIHLTLARSGPVLSITVEDHGPGFPAYVIATGGSMPVTPSGNGQGIGLMLTRSAIAQLGGRLLLSNRPEGGASARIELPLEAA